jgi:signal transduction histidine kinase
LDLADKVLAEGRSRVSDLRASLEANDDLPRSLQEIGEQHEALHGNAFRCSVVGAPRRLHPVPREEIERISAEALVNAFRHAQARQVELTLAYSKSEILVRIVDDGAGFDVAAVNGSPRGHFGLVGMRERALKINARLQISSEPGTGTVVELRVPASIAYYTELTRKWGRGAARLCRDLQKALR